MDIFNGLCVIKDNGCPQKKYLLPILERFSPASAPRQVSFFLFYGEMLIKYSRSAGFISHKINQLLVSFS